MSFGCTDDVVVVVGRGGFASPLPAPAPRPSSLQISCFISCITPSNSRIRDRNSDNCCACSSCRWVSWVSCSSMVVGMTTPAAATTAVPLETPGGLLAASSADVAAADEGGSKSMSSMVGCWIVVRDGPGDGNSNSNTIGQYYGAMALDRIRLTLNTDDKFWILFSGGLSRFPPFQGFCVEGLLGYYGGCFGGSDALYEFLR